LPGGIKIGWIFGASLKFGQVYAAMRSRFGHAA
jgi:hypothetical protein